MGVGLSLHGKFAGKSVTPASLERALSKLAEPHLLSFTRGEPEEGATPCWALLHPAAESVDVRIGPAGQVTFEAKTSTVGPGYHVWLCGILKELGNQLRIAWRPNTEDEGDRDETGYFDSGRVEDCENEMESWVGHLGRIMLERESEGHEGLMLSMPLGEMFLCGNAIVTPMGPREIDWLRAVAKDGSKGKDLFPWWNASSPAEHHRGRALVEMWRSVRWRSPQTEEERALNARVLADLEAAWALDPSLAYPWFEWDELLRFNEGKSRAAAEVARRAKAAEGRPRIGYRRGSVRHELGESWSLEVPGSFTVEMEDDSTWMAWEGDRTVRFSSFSAKKPDGSRPAAEEMLSDDLEGEVLVWRGEGVIGRGEIVREKEGGDEYFRLSGQSAAPGELGVCTVCYTDPADKAWAIQVWHSVTRPQPEEEE